ncbi:MAG: ATP-binding protein [Myxococcota bacterium]
MKSGRRVAGIRPAYIIALSLVALATISGQFIVQWSLRAELKTAEAVNIAGLQRMRSQRLAKTTLVVLSSSNEENVRDAAREANEVLREFERAHEMLVTGERSQGSPTSERSKRLLSELSPTLQNYVETIRNVLSENERTPAQRERLRARIRELEQRYLPRMDAVVSEFAQTARARLESVRRFEYLLSGVTLLILLLEGLLIFRPLERRVALSTVRLERSQRRYERAINGTNDGIWDWSTEKETLFWSERFLALTGLDRADPASWSRLRDIVNENDRTAFDEAIENGRDSLAPIDIEFRVQLDGRSQWRRLRGTRSGAYLAGSLEDIEEQKRSETERRRLMTSLEKALEESRSEVERSRTMNSIGQLASGLAHDFNNYLQAIMVQSEMLEERDGAARAATEIRKAASDAARLSQQLLALNPRDHAGTLVPVRLGEVIDDFANMLRSLLPATVSFHFDDDPRAAPVLANPQQLRQLLLNLCLNAQDAMPDGGELRIRVRAVKAGVELTVEDEGIGIDTETQSKIFEPFFTTKPVGDGSGLGLAAVRSIVQRHGGVIRVESAPAQGAVFRIVFPNTDVPVPQPTPNEQTSVGVALTIALIEDNPLVLEGSSTWLRSQAHEVYAFESGEAALAASRGGLRFDLVISDVVLPDLAGTEVLAALRQIQGELPAILVSGYTEGKVGELDGSTKFLRKPYLHDELERCMVAVLDRSSEKTKAIS